MRCALMIAVIAVLCLVAAPWTRAEHSPAHHGLDERVRLMTDPHAPPRFRVQGPLYNMPQFFKAFGVSPTEAGSRLNPQPVQIW